ncbi:response regulator [Candidatus Leptofilum sp.]|uniref:response regulator n=1 Tax=Candidatus Leptofilum sp. TaxID=3241576 RepID=UPI003B5BA5C5
MKTPRALIVEDVPDLAQIFTLALTAAGFRTTSVADGSTAKHYLATETPDLIVLDVHLPFYSGDRLLEEIRKLPRFEHTVFIIVTADTRRGEELRNQADLVLHKPISFTQLRDLSKRLTAVMTHLQTGPLPKLVDSERP